MSSFIDDRKDFLSPQYHYWSDDLKQWVSRIGGYYAECVYISRSFGRADVRTLQDEGRQLSTGKIIVASTQSDYLRKAE